MKTLLPVIIVLSAGLFVAQIFFGGKPETPNKQGGQLPVATNAAQSTTEKNMAKRSRRSPDKTLSAEMAVALNSDAPSLDEYNSAQVKQTNFQENWDVTAEQLQDSSVSQAQIDIVRKRELAIQRRDYMQKMRAETISSLSAQEELNN